VWKSDTIELAVNVVSEMASGESFKLGGVGDTAFDVVVNTELESGV